MPGSQLFRMDKFGALRIKITENLLVKSSETQKN
jgi:hypothetical protein